MTAIPRLSRAVHEAEAEELSSSIRWLYLQHCYCGDKCDCGAITLRASRIEEHLSSAYTAAARPHSGAGTILGHSARDIA